MIIIECDAIISKKDFDELRTELVAQSRTGIIILPEYCTLKAVTEPGGVIVISKED